MSRNHANPVIAVVLLALPVAVFAQDQGAEAIDNIVVTGEKSMSELRKEVFESEEDFYAIYNRLNDDDEYDVTCFYETPTGTRIKNHVCRARFISNAYSANAARGRNDVTRIANQDANPELVAKTAKFQEKLELLINENADLQAALVRYNTARARFMAERDKNGN